MNIDEELLTQKELCEWLKISSMTAYKWRKNESLPFLGEGRKIRYRKSDVVKWLEEKGKK